MVIVLHYTELCHNGYFLPSPCCSYQGAAKMLITMQISVVHINIDLKKKTWQSATQRECIALLTGKKTVNILDFIASL